MGGDGGVGAGEQGTVGGVRGCTEQCIKVTT